MTRPPPRSTRTDTLFPYMTLCRSDLGAFAADMFVMVGIASHEFQRHRAYLGTVEHQFHMGRFGVLSAHLEAVGHSHREAHDVAFVAGIHALLRSEEHTSELQSLMRISYAVFCLKKKKLTTLY